jgi:hypothetical protein
VELQEGEEMGLKENPAADGQNEFHLLFPQFIGFVSE